jgi:hypothetical protein
MHIFKGSKGAISWNCCILERNNFKKYVTYLFYHYHAVHFLEHYNLSDVSYLCSGDEMNPSVTIKQKSAICIFITEFCSQLPILPSSSHHQVKYIHITFVVNSYYSIVVKFNQLLFCHWYHPVSLWLIIFILQPHFFCFCYDGKRQEVSYDTTAVQYFLHTGMFQELHFQKKIILWTLELNHWQILLMPVVTDTKFF